MTSTTLPEELVEEILLRVSPEEPAHLVCATVVCKTWHSILSDETFRRRYRRFHKTPPLQGYIYTDFWASTIRFVPTSSMAVPAVFTPNFNNSSIKTPSAVDCRHGRVLIQVNDRGSGSMERLIVWDPIAGSQQSLSVPAYPQYPYAYRRYTAAAVLCAMNDCDHFDCHGDPFLVVLLMISYKYGIHDEVIQMWASVYSSETGDWSAPTPPFVKTKRGIYDMTPSLIGDAIYFTTGYYDIVKYNLCKQELSVINSPYRSERILIKGNDGVLDLVTMLDNCIYKWSPWQVDNIGLGASVHRVLKLDETLLPHREHPSVLFCMAEGTNTVFVGLKGAGLFTLDLRSKQVRKIGEQEMYYHTPIPYMSFYTPKYEPCIFP